MSVKIDRDKNKDNEILLAKMSVLNLSKKGGCGWLKMILNCSIRSIEKLARGWE